MQIDLIELPPYNTRNSLWLSDIFQCPIRKFDGSLRAKTFPIFIVQGDVNLSDKDKSINFGLFPYLDKEGYHFGLIHIMDENYDHDLSIYYLDGCTLIFREYFRPFGGLTHLIGDYLRSFFLPAYHFSSRSGIEYLVSKMRVRFAGKYGVLPFMKRQYLPKLPSNKAIIPIPLGYTDTIFYARLQNYSLDQSITERKYRWSFCGQSSKKDRKLMLNHLKNCLPNFIHESDGSYYDHALSGQDYWEIMTQSIFVPCPLGNINIDTYRFFEALEAGAISIVLNGYAFQPYGYYNILLGEHPIPTFFSWKDVKRFIESINSDLIHELSKNIREWYMKFNLNLRVKIRDALLASASQKLLTTDIHNLKT